MKYKENLPHLTRGSRQFLLSLLIPFSVRQRAFLSITLMASICFGMSFFIPTLLVFPLFCLGSHLVLKRLLDMPIHSLLEITRYGGINLSMPPFAVVGRDEFSRIARALYGMAERMKASQVEVKDQTLKLDEIFGAIGEGVLVVDIEGHVLQMNTTLRRWLGWYGEVKGHSAVDVLRNVQISDGLSRLAKACMARGEERLIEPEVIESTHLQGPEVKMVRAKIVAIRSGHLNIAFMVFLFDLTDLHKAEEIRREFFANVSHELKTPISAIRGYAETLQEMKGVDQNEMAVNFLGVIVRNTHQLSSLIDEMLLLSKLESGALPLNPVAYDVVDALKRVIDTMTPKALEARVTISLDVASDIDFFYVDPHRFDSVLLNLVDNSVKYNRAGGQVRVSVRQNETAHFLYVEDTGVGIPDAAQGRVFERFYRVDKAHTRLGGGSGLGLAIVKHIIQAHGGHITVRSEPNVGTVFTVMVPRSQRPVRLDPMTPL